MKETVKTSRTAGYLEKMFRALNAEFFAGEEIEEPIITIQSTKGAYGHVTVSKLWSAKEARKHELNIGADTLERPIENVAATMLHEMVHLYNLAHDVQDCSRGNTYHNRKFKDEAEKRGLCIEKHEKYGWTITSPSDRLLEFILLNNWTEIQMNRGGFSWTPRPTGTDKAGDSEGDEGGKPKTTRKKSSTRKYECPCCGLSVRATKVVAVKCIECDEQLIEV